MARLEAELGGKPDAVLVHATPGFEERVLEGLASGSWGSPISVAGGSAADDDLSGAWGVFDAERERSGRWRALARTPAQSERGVKRYRSRDKGSLT